MIYLIYAFLAPHTARAVDTEFGEAENITQYLNNILSWLLPIVGGLALLMVIYAGYIYMTSQGVPERLTLAKDIIIGVVVGILLLFLMQLLLREIGTI